MDREPSLFKRGKPAKPEELDTIFFIKTDVAMGYNRQQKK